MDSPVAAFDGLRIGLPQSPQARALLAPVFASLPPSPDTTSGADLTLRVEVTAEGDGDLPGPDARPSWFHGRVAVHREGDRWHLADGDARVVVNPSDGVIVVRASRRALSPTSVTSRTTLFMALTLGLHELGRFHLHAGCAAHATAGAVLFPGTAGSGKTSLTIGLAEAGWTPLADDAVFLRPAGDRVVVAPFRKTFHVAPQTAKHFPAWSPGLADGWEGKVDVDPGARVPTGERGAPQYARALWFPRIVDADASALRPVSQAEALGALLESSTLATVTDLADRAGHVRALEGLVAGATQVGLLLLGRDALTDPGRIGALLAAGVDS